MIEVITKKIMASIARLLSKPVKAHARAEAKELSIKPEHVTVTLDLPTIILATKDHSVEFDATYHWKSGTPYAHWIKASKALIELDENTDLLPADPFSGEQEVDCPFSQEPVVETEPTEEEILAMIAAMEEDGEFDDLLTDEQLDEEFAVEYSEDDVEPQGLPFPQPPQPFEFTMDSYHTPVVKEEETQHLDLETSEEIEPAFDTSVVTDWMSREYLGCEFQSSFQHKVYRMISEPTDSFNQMKDRLLPNYELVA
ncbi:hypothetical protein CGI18_07165 [Vibrio parahaemolyticus]|uniref:hypothetical protein n=1 Tax=Vibrio parahaemolyticus TaxID=670 RepID=UPI00111F201C|nr:hypothetical protein [Vibrio parahaemolyticus]TOK48264.1 hypothetical protein CGI18_07165 [Vibrio parahaemolyticus]